MGCAFSRAAHGVADAGPAAAPAAAADDAGFYTGKRALQEARGIDGRTGIADVALIDALWLMELEGAPPCRQQLPPAAFFKGSVDAQDVLVLAVSYPWLSKTHPDPDGWHLRILRHFLRLFFTLENKGNDEEGNEVTRRPSGQGKRVAIFMDWQSLFQEHSPGGRTADQSAAFGRALRSINIWYANSETMVWRLTRLPPAPQTGHDVNPYPNRGWCFFELGVSEMITPGDRVLDLGLAMEEGGEGRSGVVCLEAKRFYAANGLGGWAPLEDDQYAADRTTTVVKRCSLARQFPIAPAAFNEALAKCTFTNGADAEFVKGKYAKTFQEVVAEATELRFANCGFESALSTLEPTLRVCAGRLRGLDLSFNFRISGGLSVVAVCTALESLKLNGCRGLTGGLEPLQALTQLTSLDLGECGGLTGGLEPLQALTQLTSLNLGGCRGLTGGLEPLQALTQLTSLNLHVCVGLTGGLEPLRVLTQLTYLDLLGCEGLTGGLEPLQVLTQLTSLDLDTCKGLTGGLEPLQALTQLTSLNLYGCVGLTGGLEPLQALTQLTSLYLLGCDGLTGKEDFKAHFKGGLLL